MSSPTPTPTLKQQLQTLHTQRTLYERDTTSILDILTAPNPNPNGSPIGIDTPLVDNEGYPRNDIDVMQARTLRKRLKERQTDVRLVNDRMELALKEDGGEDGELLARKAWKPKPKYD